MQNQKQVLVNGEQMGIVIHRDKPVMTFNMIGTAFGITEKKSANIFYHFGKELDDPLTYCINKPEAKALGFDVHGKAQYRIRLFTKEAIEYMAKWYIKATSFETYTAVIEDYFDAEVTIEIDDEPLYKIPDSIFSELSKPEFKLKDCFPREEFKPGVILPPPEVKPRIAENVSEDDEILDLAAKIIADRNKTKDMAEQNRLLKFNIKVIDEALAETYKHLSDIEAAIGAVRRFI